MVKYVDDTTAAMDFPNKDPEERFCSSFRQHWSRMLMPMLKALALTIVLAVIGGLSLSTIESEKTASQHILLASLLVFFIGAQLEFITRFYRYFLYVIIVTDRRVHRIKRSLLTFDDHECIDLWAIQEIRKSQHGPLQKLFGFGSIILEGQDIRLTLHFVPQVSRRYEELLALRELVRRT
jgi:hypothetical protein